MVQKATSRRMEIRKRKEKRNEKGEASFSFSSASTVAAAATIDLPQKRYMGVRRSPSGRWVAEIKGTAQRIRLWLGTFDTAEEAARAYDEAACLLRGANTRTNFWPRSSGFPCEPGTTSSILPAKVFNHLLRHIETQRAADPQPPSPPPPSTTLPSPQPPMRQRQIDNQSEFEPINIIAYSEEKAREEEVDKGVDFADMSIGSEEELSCFYAPLEMSMMMEEASKKVEMETYEYWLMISSAAKNV